MGSDEAFCPNCQSRLEAGEAPGERRCPVCRWGSRPCPSCGGMMIKRVEVPESGGIQDSELPLSQCQLLWVCEESACGLRHDAEL